MLLGIVRKVKRVLIDSAVSGNFKFNVLRKSLVPTCPRVPREDNVNLATHNRQLDNSMNNLDERRFARTVIPDKKVQSVWLNFEVSKAAEVIYVDPADHVFNIKVE